MRIFLASILAVVSAAGADDLKPLGAVTAVEGLVMIQERDGALDPIDANELAFVTAGQRLRTATSKAEFVPTPGAYVSLGVYTELELVAINGEAVTLRLLRGSMIVDALKVKESNAITVLTGDATTQIDSKGQFRFDSSSEKTHLEVWKGKASVVGGGAERELKRKDAAEMSATGIEVSKLEHPTSDALTEWRRKRSLNTGIEVYQSREQFGLGELPDRERSGIGQQAPARSRSPLPPGGR